MQWAASYAQELRKKLKELDEEKGIIIVSLICFKPDLELRGKDACLGNRNGPNRTNQID